MSEHSIGFGNALVDTLQDEIKAKDAEIERLQARESEAVRLINAAFGEYACVASKYLSEQEKGEFNSHFGEPAREFLRSVIRPTGGKDGRTS